MTVKQTFLAFWLIVGSVLGLLALIAAVIVLWPTSAAPFIPTQF